MINRRTKLFGAAAILIGLSAPFVAQAHERDDTWLYVAGAVAAYAYLDDHADHRHYAHAHAHHHKHKHGKWHPAHKRHWRAMHDRRDHAFRHYDAGRDYRRDGRRADGRRG